MSEVVAEFEKEIAAFRARYQGRPRREMTRLFLVALEREQIVSVGYREEIIARRVEAMPVDERVREVIRSALVWVWKDEEMHAIYIRGALFKMGGVWLRLVSLVQQLSGGIAGWASSVAQHLTFRAAPFARTLATLLTLVGWMAGKVPRAVRKEIRYHSFRQFSVFNIEAERTAALAWERLVEIARENAAAVAPSVSLADFAQMAEDEDRHARIFRIFADALDDEDRLLPGETADTLAEKIRAVGENFLERSRRAGASEQPLGKGGAVVAAEGRDAGGKVALFRSVLDDAGLPAVLAARARAAGGRPPAVAVKPTFMLGYHRDDPSVVTDPELLRELARYLREHGAGSVTVVESPNLYDRFFEHRTVPEVAAYFGVSDPGYTVTDLSGEQVSHAYARGMGQYSVGRAWKEADLRITFGKLRSHPVEGAHLSIANLEGLGPRCDEFLFVERQAHRDAAVMTLASAFPPHFALLDGHDAAADGLVGVMGCRAPRAPRRLYAGEDALAVDLVAARHLGVDAIRESAILRAACHWFGDPTSRTEVRGVDAPVAGWRGPHSSDFWALLGFFAYPVFVVASGRGTLFVPAMDEAAFPARDSGALLRAGRWAMRALLGLRQRRSS